jgi:hypothetical protein
LRSAASAHSITASGLEPGPLPRAIQRSSTTYAQAVMSSPRAHVLVWNASAVDDGGCHGTHGLDGLGITGGELAAGSCRLDTLG